MSDAIRIHIPARRFAAAALVAAALAVTALFGLLGGPAAPPAHAGPQQLSLMMDDNLLVYGSHRDRTLSLFRMRQYGVDGVRATVLWSVLAQDAMKGANARRFRASDPSTYPQYSWDGYDDLVLAADIYGMAVVFNVTGPGPPWAHRKSKDRLNQHSYRPYEAKFRDFVRAVGRRYSGSYRDENGSRRILPRVRVWSIYNEPNQGHTLTPQSEYSPVVKKVIPMAPVVYRRLLSAGLTGLRATGHGRDVILMGELAPQGKTEIGPRKQLRPKLFLRELFCLKPNMQRYTGKDAKARECDKLKPGVFDGVIGVAHHPYTQKNSPLVRDPHPDSITTANIGQLPALLDQIAARTRLIPRGLTVALTENGWQTNPPDPVDGISPANQAYYMNLADQLAWANPRISAVTQFLYRDVHPRNEYRNDLKAKWFTWQSGITKADGSPKPSLGAYALQLNVTGAGANVGIWGQARGAPNNKPTQVYLQYRPPGTTTWRNIKTIQVTQANGFFTDAIPSPGPGVWRAIWTPPDFSYYFLSRESIVSS